tara:strand:- start:345 stop:1217 length:873 start_codon:yes stop_codon:yes gene_type:complete
MESNLKVEKAIEAFISITDMILVFREMKPLSPENTKIIKRKILKFYATPHTERPYGFTTDNLLNAIRNPRKHLLMDSIGGAAAMGWIAEKNIQNLAAQRVDNIISDEGSSIICKKNSRGVKFNTAPNFRKCSHLWPNYPCYNNHNESCEDVSGTTNLDPIDDILYGVGEAYVLVTNILGKFLGCSPSSKESEEKTIAWIRNYGTTISPVPSQLTTLDTARFVGPVLNTVNDYAANTINNWLQNRITGGGISNSLGNGQYLHIINPKTNKKVSIFSKKGRSILQKYMKKIT